MSDTPPHPLLDEVAGLSETERRIVDLFIHRQRVARDITAEPSTLGNRVADRVAAFGGSWPFILIAVGAITVWSRWEDQMSDRAR